MENRRRIAVSLLSGAWGATPERELRYHGPQFRALRDVAGAILGGGLKQTWAKEGLTRAFTEMEQMLGTRT